MGLLIAMATGSQTCNAEEVKSVPPKPAAAPAWPADKPAYPAALPGNGLAQHDFLYAGEGKAQNIYIVRKGQIVWKHEDSTGKGEISDAVRMSNGNVLFAHQYGITLLSADDKVLWHLDAPPKTEIHTAQPIGKDHVIYVQNGDPAKLIVVNIVTGKTVKDLTIPTGNAKSTHGQFRHARLTEAGTLLVSHMDMKKVVEYDADGKAVATFDAPAVWSAKRLKGGSTLICANRSVREVDVNGQTTWEFTPAEMPDYKVTQFQTATRLANGNTLINNWVNQWSTKIDPATAPVQAWEVTPEKKLVWALRSWEGATNLGPATTIQILDEAEVAEDVRFGEIK